MRLSQESELAATGDNKAVDNFHIRAFFRAGVRVGPPQG